jgi:hypothetical protein
MLSDASTRRILLANTRMQIITRVIVDQTHESMQPTEGLPVASEEEELINSDTNTKHFKPLTLMLCPGRINVYAYERLEWSKFCVILRLKNYVDSFSHF